MPSGSVPEARDGREMGRAAFLVSGLGKDLMRPRLQMEPGLGIGSGVCKENEGDCWNHRDADSWRSYKARSLERQRIILFELSTSDHRERLRCLLLRE